MPTFPPRLPLPPTPHQLARRLRSAAFRPIRAAVHRLSAGALRLTRRVRRRLLALRPIQLAVERPSIVVVVVRTGWTSWHFWRLPDRP